MREDLIEHLRKLELAVMSAMHERNQFARRCSPEERQQADILAAEDHCRNLRAQIPNRGEQ